MLGLILNLQVWAITNRSIRQTFTGFRKLALTVAGQIRSNMRNITSLTRSGCVAGAGEAGQFGSK